ncbi:hypothetical protein QWZ08_17250 [Ferruginibacter paludis]|uniref:DinB family protein n=1 Tax=Ferruginibacter paludis TaxID=1310417 RepID=UPI0025B36E5E|nr:DinB family protein [Ferruginibacter paludis]MDN3657402.1 hypothetical protein [Ferruginibacter paludis]
MKKLSGLVKQLEGQITNAAKINPAISQASVGWHIEHSLLVLNAVMNALKKSDAAKYKWKFNLMRTFIYTIGKIPAGKVKAPAAVQPKGEFNIEKIQADFITVQQNVNALKDLPANHFFTHPFFGDLNVKPAITFLKLHTRHHLKIIQRIIKQGLL